MVFWGRDHFLQDHPEPSLPLEEVFLVKTLDSARPLLERMGHTKDCSQLLGLSLAHAVMPSGVWGQSGEGDSQIPLGSSCW